VGEDGDATMSEMDLRGTTALVTGGGRRLGAAIADALAEAGCDLVVHYGTSGEGAEQVVQRARRRGRRATSVRADLTNRGELVQLMDRTREFSGGKLAVLVNNAGNFERVVPAEMDDESWDRAMLLNATVPYRLSVGLADELRAAHGCMIAVACVSALRPWRNYVAYSVSKAALVHLVRGLATAFAPDVRVNAVAPGSVLVPEGYREDQLDRLRRRIPLGRFGDALDVARAVCFLAANDYITGQVLAIDGGQSIG